MFHKIQKIWHTLITKSVKGTFSSVSFKKKNTYTPAYTIISKDLENPNEQIFEGAVCYLCKIALLKKMYRDDIKKILETYMRQNSEKTIRCAYIKGMLNKNFK